MNNHASVLPTISWDRVTPTGLVESIDEQRDERQVVRASVFKFDLAGAMACLAPETGENHQLGRDTVCDDGIAKSPVVVIPPVVLDRAPVQLEVAAVIPFTDLPLTAEIAEVATIIAVAQAAPAGPYLPAAVVSVVRPTQFPASRNVEVKRCDHRGQNRRNASQQQPVVRTMFSVSLVASLLVGAAAFGHSYIFSGEPNVTAISARDNAQQEAQVNP